MHPDDVDTGAVILTGEALRRENAKAIADVLAEMGGEFVCAAAGHHMESMLAAYGSGAAKASHDRGMPLLNIDIGGGTTKLALVEARQRRAYGGDPHRRAARGRRRGGPPHAARSGRPAPRRARRLRLESRRQGQRARDRARDRVDGRCAGRGAHAGSAACASRGAVADGAARASIGGVAGAMFSGGVGEYVYGREARDFGDLGRRLGHARFASGSTRAASVPAAAGGRVHPRDRARRVGIQRAAVGQHDLSLEPRRAAAAQEPAGHPAARCAGRRRRSGGGRRGDPRTLRALRSDRRRGGSRARVPLARRACVRAPRRRSRAASSRRCRARLRRRSRCS